MESEESIAVSPSALAAVEAQLAQLTDLFVRRLREDAAKNALIETVQEQLRASSDLLRYRNLESLLREALLAIDRLQSEPATEELIESVVDELHEVFARRNLEPIDDEGAFDPRVHEAVGSVVAGGGIQPGDIVAVHRRGYVLGDRVLRPTRVTVAVRADVES